MTSSSDDRSVTRNVGARSVPVIRANPPGAFLSLMLALAAFTTTPPEGPADFLRMHFGSYLITYFDLAVMAAGLWLLFSLRIRIHLNEKKIILALLFIIATRIVSLIVARSMAMGQLLSVFRYVETLVVVILLANLLGAPRNRKFFLAGVMLGALTETIGGLAILVMHRGESRGFWLGIDNYKWQIYLLFVCTLFLFKRKNIFWTAFTASTLFVGVLATQTRAALVLFCIMILMALLSRRQQLLKPILVTSLLLCLTVISVLRVFPDAEQALGQRIEELWTGGGVIGWRIVMFEMAIAAYVQHPIIGIGSGGFARQQNALYLEINDAFSQEYETLYDYTSTHNTVLGIAAETGTVGLIAYLFWVVTIVRTCVNSLRMESINRDNFALAACLFMLALMSQDFWGQASFLASSSCLLGFVLGWRRNHRSEISLTRQVSPVASVTP